MEEMGIEEQIKKEKKKGNILAIIMIVDIIILIMPFIILGVQIAVDTRADICVGRKEASERKIPIQAYNEQFERYEGTAVSGTTVKAMIDTVRHHNNTNRADTTRMVQIIPNSSTAVDISASTFTADPNAGDISYATLKGNIQSGKQYRVECGHDLETGLVTTISYKSIE